MITGQNSEIRHEDVVFHIQTEDKGLANPFIVSLIYVGGQVLAAKRTSYADDLAGGFEEQGVAELMDRQHRTMIAAIRHGRFDDLVQKFLATKGSNGDAAGDSLVDMVGSFLGAEVPESLSLELADVETPRPGEHYELRLRALASPSRRPICSAAVRVELISPMREPEILAQAQTDAEGWLTVAFLIPPVDGDMAALVISAVDDIGDVEETILL